MTKEALIEDIESMKQATKLLLHTDDITKDGFKALNLGFDSWIERVKNCSIPNVGLTLPSDDEVTREAEKRWTPQKGKHWIRQLREARIFAFRSGADYVKNKIGQLSPNGLDMARCQH